jgi:hypothetical protein
MSQWPDMPEKALRREAFEIAEYLRSLWARRLGSDECRLAIREPDNTPLPGVLQRLSIVG